MSRVYNMTPRERMIGAIKKEETDRVPVAPDMSNMIPCRLTGLPFWDIYLHNKPDLYHAYLNTVGHFGIDGWFIYDFVRCQPNSCLTSSHQILEQRPDRILLKQTTSTPDGDLEGTMAYFRDNPPALQKGMVKDLKADFKKLCHLYSGVQSYDKEYFLQCKAEIGEKGLMGQYVATPGLQILFSYFDGGIEQAIYAYEDYPELIEELCYRMERHETQRLEIMLDLGIDSVLMGGSGSITLQSPSIWDKLSFPTIQKHAKMCREAGVLSGIHSCGKEMHIVERCAKESDLDYINPLEIPPMGDSTLAQARAVAGTKLTLMGNLHTTETMLSSRETVRLESLRAIRDAGLDGAFILSTGDQCGRDTPDENIAEMLLAANTYGRYPIDIPALQAEIERLEQKCNSDQNEYYL